jgi:uroporphyrinogen decarboxylase
MEKLIAQELDIQKFFGVNMLKGPYSKGFQQFPYLRYGTYGYENYFMAYALFPDLMEQDFKLQADVAMQKNALAAQAIIQGGLPRMIRLDHDLADSRGTLVDIKSLDKIWFPHFARSIEPFLKAGIRLIWHCDGNLMQMVPRLLEAGLGGFQGFQYEDGMDYEAICKMKDRDGSSLFIIAGCSVTRTLPHGTSDDVRRELKWVVDNGPEIGLMLGPTSSIAPNTNRENVLTFIEGLKYYQEHGRD